MGKKIKSFAKGTVVGQMIGAGEKEAERAMKEQAAAQQRALREQMMAAQQANPDNLEIANVQTGGSADEADALRKKRTAGAGPVSTSLGINI